MKIRYMSDLHLEFADFRLPPDPEDKDTVLVLAGDILVAEASVMYQERYQEFWKHLKDRFKMIVYVAGNHESYGGSIIRTPEKIQKILDQAEMQGQVVYLDRSSVILSDEQGDVRFIGATLWTDAGGVTLEESQRIEAPMTDFRVIRTGPPAYPYLRKYAIWDSVRRHVQDKEFIFPEIKTAKEFGQRVVVVTHHAPHAKSVDRAYHGDFHNKYYFSDLEKEILETQPNLWIHGHMHHVKEYALGETQVRTNPRGYPSEFNISDEQLMFDSTRSFTV